MSQEQLAAIVQFVPLILLFVIFYFVLIRPQKKKEKKLRDMIAAIKTGDEVVTIGGIHGKVTRIKDDVFVIESGIGTTKSYITIDRGSVSRVNKVSTDTAAAEEVAEIPDEPEEN